MDTTYHRTSKYTKIFMIQSMAVFVSTVIALCLLMGITHAQDFVGLARTARADAEIEVRRQNAASRARVARARSITRFRPPATAFGFASGVGGMPRMTTSAKMARIHGSRYVSADYYDETRIFHLSSISYLQRTGTHAREVMSSPDLISSFRAAMNGVCPAPPICSPFESYRRADGTCNNLLFPLQGSQSTPQPRYVPAAYQDALELDAPRLRGVGGLPLPSPRAVSNAVHNGVGPTAKDVRFTLFLMLYGQFTDHDMVITPIAMESDGSDIECCKKRGAMLKHSGDLHPDCLPIKIPPRDPHFPPWKMFMNFVRSMPAMDPLCRPGQRQQLNRLTSYIDASNVYGSSQQEQDFLRQFAGGRLRQLFGQHLPEDPDPCDDVKFPDYCLKAGDDRVMEQPALSMIHTAFNRWHNRIAARLAVNGWPEEIHFQETRKIVAAAMQHITYNQFLPLILGDLHTNFFGLYSTPMGFNTVYSPGIDASIRNVFAAASYRYGHSQIPNALGKMNSIEGLLVEERLLEDTFFDSNMILNPITISGEGANGLARFTATDRSHLVDSRIEESVRNKLFRDKMDFFDTLDLASLNIQRGRDHGLPPYNAYRVLCGRPPYLTWNDAIDHAPAEVQKLRSVYNDPRDIDIFTGALSEIPVPGGVVGPTNACIIGNQFRALKRGDRFFYENPFGTTGFTLDQLNSIKRITLAKIICDTMFTPLVQPNIFLKAGPGNPLTNCAHLPDIDIEAFWIGPKPFHGKPHKGIQVLPPKSPISALKFQRIPNFLVPRLVLNGKQGGKLGHKRSI